MAGTPRARYWLPLLGLLVTMLIWSSNNIVGKIIMREGSPLMVALVRFTLAGLFFYLPVFLALHRGAQRFSRQEWPRLVFLGTVGTCGSLVLYLLGLLSTPATAAGIYQITGPLFIAVLAWLWLGERLSRGRVLGILVAAAGAGLLIAAQSSGGLGGGSLLGALFILGSNLTWSGYTLGSKEILARRSPLLVLAAANLVALVAIWPAALLLGAGQELPRLLEWSPTAWLVMAYLVVFMSTSSQWLYVRCLREVGASQASAFQYLAPLFTAVQAALFLGEAPTLPLVACGLLILLGVWLVNRPARQVRPAPARVARPDRALRPAPPRR
jgi:drug/metabolite transporter (DMT)-like permease